MDGRVRLLIWPKFKAKTGKRPNNELQIFTTALRFPEATLVACVNLAAVRLLGPSHARGMRSKTRLPQFLITARYVIAVIR